MKKVLLMGCLLGLVSASVQAATTTTTSTTTAPVATKSSKPALTTNEQKLSYTLGYDMGDNFKNQSVMVIPSVFEQGLLDGMKGESAQMSPKEMQQTLLNFQKELLAKRAEQFKTVGADNVKAGADFLAKNKTAKGVVTLPSGLQYKVLTTGTGPKPTASSVVTVDYSGTLLNGQEFDSSYKRGQPATFSLSQVIQGWQEALPLMNTGSTWEIFVPANLAYGERSVGPIGPDETLVFKIHLIKIGSATADQGQ